jgi:phosphatidate cytidylyltransferase
VSAAPQTADISASAPGTIAPADWSRRALYGALLALVGVLVTLAGGYVFAGFVTIAALAAVREWHRLVGTERWGREFFASAAAIGVALTSTAIFPSAVWPLAILLAGALLAAAMAATRGGSLLWSGMGALYIGVPAWSLVALRLDVANSQWAVLGIFLVIWTGDTGALIVGRLLGGPKLIPALSPNKTWTGFAGGLLFAALFGAIYVAILGGNPAIAFVLALLLALTGHTGDLFESWVKRRVGRKDSGELIPGHGGVLDRLDSTLFVAPLASGLVFLFGIARLFGGHS